MKQTHIKSLALAWAILAIVAGGLAFTGCASGGSNPTAARVTYQVEGTTIATADAAMNAWRDWVILGNATQAQVDKVKELYGQYYAAQQIAKAAAMAFVIDPTPENNAALREAVTKSGTAELTVISQVTAYTKK